jgi:hypothetical protein
MPCWACSSAAAMMRERCWDTKEMQLQLCVNDVATKMIRWIAFCQNQYRHKNV